MILPPYEGNQGTFGQFWARFGPVLAQFLAPFGPINAARTELRLGSMPPQMAIHRASMHAGMLERSVD